MLAVVEVEAFERLVQGAQCPEFVDGTERTATGQGQRDAGAASLLRGCAWEGFAGRRHAFECRSRCRIYMLLCRI